MRTVTFFGLIVISESIGAQTGYAMSAETVLIGAFILSAAIFADLFELLGLIKPWR